MKQLLTWCGKRELDSGVLKAADPNASNSGTEEGARKIGKCKKLQVAATKRQEPSR